MRVILLIGLCLLQINAFASREVGNGGQSIYIGENAFLRDIVERNNCRWRSGKAVFKMVPKLTEIMKSIEEVHWYLKERLVDEISNLKFCFTEKRLPPLSYNNSDDLYVFTNQIYDQPAINDKGVIFVDKNIFDDMNDVHQAFVIIHEASHEFFDKKEDRATREPRLRELIMNLYDHYTIGLDYESTRISLEMSRLKYLVIDLDQIDKRVFFDVLDWSEGELEIDLDLFDRATSFSFLYHKGFKKKFKKLNESVFARIHDKNISVNTQEMLVGYHLNNKKSHVGISLKLYFKYVLTSYSPASSNQLSMINLLLEKDRRAFNVDEIYERLCMPLLERGVWPRTLRNNAVVCDNVVDPTSITHRQIKHAKLAKNALYFLPPQDNGYLWDTGNNGKANKYQKLVNVFGISYFKKFIDRFIKEGIYDINISLRFKTSWLGQSDNYFSHIISKITEDQLRPIFFAVGREKKTFIYNYFKRKIENISLQDIGCESYNRKRVLWAISVYKNELLEVLDKAFL